jgi:TolB-like protein/DNA-binding winged helix-turn-helix (wHTH) protein/Tfp pilus assembly protein PilF
LAAPVIQFEDVEIDLSRFEVRRGGLRVHLEKQPFDLLALLLRNPGDLVTRKELADSLWGSNVFVETDRSINNAIRKIRLALGDDPEHPRFIETVAGRGYRFIARVSFSSDGQPESIPQQTGMRSLAAAPENRYQSAPEREVDLRRLSLPEPAPVSPVATRRKRWQTAAAFALTGAIVLAIAFVVIKWKDRPHSTPKAQIDSLAVLPLANLSGDPAQEYFSDGMTDALITDLAQMGSTKVISRTSVMRYKKTEKSLPEIAGELNVDGIVEGTVQRSGERVRITAQLIQGLSDKTLWANSYERDLRDVLALQDEIARAIASEIGLKVTSQAQIRPRAAHTVDPLAYEVYLKGLTFSRNQGEQSTRISIEYFNRAIQLDPQWAAPYAQLARSYHWIASSGHTDLYPKSKAAALHAIGIDDGLAEAHSALAFVLHNYDWNWSGAEREYRRALELNPNYSEAHHGYAVLLTAAGRTEEAVAEIRRAQELDPILIPLQVNVGVVYSCLGRHDEAIEQLLNTTQLNPKNSYARVELGMAYLRKGDYQGAIANLEKAVASGKDDPDELLSVEALAYGYAVAGRRQDALRTLRQLEQQEAKGKIVAAGWDTGLYPIYFALGQNDQAFAWLEKAYRTKSDSLLYLRCWPEFDHLRAEPRFADLVRRVGIPQ